MKTFLVFAWGIIVGLTLFALLLSWRSAHAFTSLSEMEFCAPTDAVEQWLDSYGETLVGKRAVKGGPTMWQFWSPNDGMSWTIVMKKGDVSCVITEGGRAQLRGEPL